jgi:translocation and assembly module TamB
MLRSATLAMATVIVFVAAIVLGLALHLGLAPARRSVVQRVDAVLEPVFAGKLTIERIGGLGLAHVDDVDARVDDPDGKLVVRATGVRAHVATAALVRSLLGGDLIIDVSDVTVATAEVNLDTDGAGDIRIARAFAPRSPSPPGGPPGRVVHLTISPIHVTHAAAHGQLDGAPPIDGDLDGADARVLVSSGSPTKIAVDVDRAEVVARALPGGHDARGAVEAHLTLPSAAGHDLGLHAIFQGAFGPLVTHADLAFDGGAIDAVIDAPALSPEQGQSLVPGWPLVLPAALHAEAHGSLPRLDVSARASAGIATVDAVGPLTVAPRLQGALHVDAKGFDVHSVLGLEPTTDVAVSGDVTFAEQPSGAVDARAVLDVPACRVGTLSTPPFSVTAEMSRAPPPGAGLTASARATVRVPGAPMVVTARLMPKKKSFVLSFAADANTAEPKSVELLGGIARGRAIAHADGAIDLGTSTLDARGSLAGEAIEAFGMQAQAARVEVHATGALSAPTLDVQVAGEDIDAGRLNCSSVRGSASVEIHDGVTLRDADAVIRSSEQHARLRANVVRLGSDEVRVENAAIDGFGAPIEGTLRWAPGHLTLQAKSGPIDLARVAKFTKVSILQGGRMSLDVDASVGAGVADGRVALDVSHAAFATFKDANAHVEATLHGRQAAGRVTLGVSNIGSIDIQSPTVHVGEGNILSAASWRRSWGAATMNVHVDLPKLVAELPPTAIPFRQIHGLLDMTVHADLDAAGDPSPDVDWSATTTGLVIVGGDASAPWRLEGIDPTVHLTVNGETAATALDVQLHDGTGPILQVNATSADVPYASLFGGDEWAEALRAMPFAAEVSMPPRSLDTFPAAWGLNGLRGDLSANVDWRGAARHPAIQMLASLERGRGNRTTSSLPVDLALSAQYDGARAIGTLQATDKKKVLLDASASVDVRARDLLDGLSGMTILWTGAGHAKLDAFPLRSIAFLDDRQVRGRASGDVLVEQLHDDARATATLTVDALKVGDIACRAARIQASIDGHTLDASAHVEQDDGSVDAKVHAGSRWGRALAPALDPSQAGQASLSAKQFRVGLLLPFVSGLFTGLDGRLDANARIDIDPTTQAVRPQGTANLTDGEFELASLGGEFSDVSAKASLTPDGIVRIEDVVAHGVNGRVEAAASARLAGLTFAGGRATVQVPKKDPLPIVFDGVQVGMMDGRFEIAADPAAGRKGLDVAVNVPSMHMQLPLSRTHDVQALGDLEGVTTGVLRGPGDFVDVPLDVTFASPLVGSPREPIKIAVKLGSDVEVARGEDLDVHLEGEPVITLAQDVTVTGQIRLIRGTLDVYGKPFEIESGTVTFGGEDPGNPQVVLSAGWSAQDGTRVTADFVGPLKTGKVTLRSEPALAQTDILSLILFGTAEADTGAANQQASTVAGAAGGAATAPINRALGGVNRALDNLGLAGGITTKIDTSQTNPRPEVELQIARDISLQVAWVLGVPPPGSNPDSTFVTLDWRFLRTWSLEGTRGDAGTSILDVIWQHRY